MMIRRFASIAGLLMLGGLCGSGAFAATPVIERDYPCTAAFAVTLTTFSWTAVPSSNCSGRIKIVLNNPLSNTKQIGGIVTATSATPSVATTTASIELGVGSNDRGYPLSDESYLWMISRNAGSTPDTVYGQEFLSR